MVIFECIVEVIVVEPLDMRVKVLKEIRQIMDLRESKLQLNQHIFYMIDQIPRISPFYSHLLHQIIFLLAS